MAQVVNPELQGLNVNVFRQSDIEASVADQMDAAIAGYGVLTAPCMLGTPMETLDFDPFHTCFPAPYHPTRAVRCADYFVLFYLASMVIGLIGACNPML